MGRFASCRSCVWLAPAIVMGFPKCENGVDMPLGDLPNMPLSLGSSDACFAACQANQDCTLFSFHSPNCSYNGNTCNDPVGCCWLKSVEVAGHGPHVNNCSCSGYLRLPKTNFAPTRSPPKDAKNMLYILVDDLRPELEAYGQSAMTHHSPYMKALADSGTVFDNAHCQIAVCSPSRISFLTGRRPDHAGIYNFINHFRQADCGLNKGGVSFTGNTFKTVKIGGCEWGGAARCGGSGQCCSLCSEDANCGAWTYTHRNSSCMLKMKQGEVVTDEGAVSGVRGTLDTHASWTSIPQHFRKSGWLTLSSGKIYHTEEGGSGNVDPDLNGPGMPPNMDPRAWSDGLSMQKVNDVANMFDCTMGENTDCPVDADIDGTVRDPSTTEQLCDRVIADDAVLKLRLAAQNLRETGQPFFMAAGFRKPHLSFRFPRPILDLLPAEEDTDVATHPTLDPSQPAIAHMDTAPQSDPFQAVDNATARQWRLFYRAAVAWVDSQIGRVLTELKTLGLENETMVVLHSDHGWSLGEHGEWQKFSNFEHGTRVPLVMRVPWIPESARGTRSSVLAELIDIFPTMAAALDVPMEGPEQLDGKSLLPVLKNPGCASTAAATKSYALSQYPRCPKNVQNSSEFFKANDCMMTDRTQIAFVGYTIRTDVWRYTEWVRWNGTTLEPDWSTFVARELYSHEGDTGFDFNAFENVCEHKDNPDVVAQLSDKLHTVVNNQQRLWREIPKPLAEAAVITV
eukprot:TRINITY_DN26_c0_g2_i2.p1 TRINITY_DN26_c0_g2~~TRINITY_DN26_c0_g2_i2.p1  ORF type:complete len:737 (-),score=84.45 TRINITY_DN26_c0_g2_i2:169-2379(-)